MESLTYHTCRSPAIYNLIKPPSVIYTTITQPNATLLDGTFPTPTKHPISKNKTIICTHPRMQKTRIVRGWPARVNGVMRWFFRPPRRSGDSGWLTHRTGIVQSNGLVGGGPLLCILMPASGCMNGRTLTRPEISQWTIGGIVWDLLWNGRVHFLNQTGIRSFGGHGWGW